MPYTFIISVALTNTENFSKTPIFVLGIIVFYSFLLFKICLNTEVQKLPSLEEEAKLVEKLAKAKLGERDFARKLYDFEQEMGNDFEKALHFLATNTDTESAWIGLCWLSRKTSGDIPVSRVRAELEKLRAKELL